MMPRLSERKGIYKLIPIGLPLCTKTHWAKCPLHQRVCPKDVSNSICYGCENHIELNACYMGLAWDIYKERQTYWVKPYQFYAAIRKKLEESGSVQDALHMHAPELVVFETGKEYEVELVKKQAVIFKPNMETMDVLKALSKRSVWAIKNGLNNLNLEKKKFSTSEEWTSQ